MPRGQFKLAKSSSLITGEAASTGPAEVALGVERVAVGMEWGAQVGDVEEGEDPLVVRLFLGSDLRCLVSGGALLTCEEAGGK